MRQRRWLAPPDHPAPVYHGYSRVVDQRFIFDDLEKFIFRNLLRELAEFCQVRVLTFCFMSNHFHLLLEVPRPPEKLPSSEESLQALSRLSGCQDVPALRQQLEAFRAVGDGEGEARWLARIHARRWNLSQFFKLLKQRYSVSYNRRHSRKGTLWEERFHSVLVEGDGHALVATGAYIDLNPVRAGMVKDPKDYRWSGYGEAVAGETPAREGLKRIVRALVRSETVTDEEVMTAYRRLLFEEGREEREPVDEEGRRARGAIEREARLKVLEQKGRLTAAEYLRCRVRYFCDGAVLGSRAYVEGIFQASRARFGPRRRSGARRMRGLDGDPLFTVRDLRLRVFR